MNLGFRSVLVIEVLTGGRGGLLLAEACIKSVERDQNGSYDTVPTLRSGFNFVRESMEMKKR